MDSFDTAALRSRVLAAWAASPSRFREDANAEEELVRGAYRDRLVVELAQNAADAAVRAGVPGRLLLRLDDTRLVAANVGAALDAAGVGALSTLRASVKRDDDPAQTVGRFGVGFAAALAITDAPAMISRSGGVRWSRAEAIQAIAAFTELTDELARREDAVPVLRLPFPAEGEIPQHYDTAVVLPLRDDQAAAVAAELLAAVDDALLLALPGLAEVIVEVDGVRRALATHRFGPDVVVVDGARSTRWRLADRAGRAEPALLADRPVEEQARPHWSVTVAVPVDEQGAPRPLPDSIPRVIHAPTPTDERTELPALVIATFPLDSTRRRVAPGALTQELVTQVARAYGSLAAELRGPGALDLVPGVFGGSELDTALIAAIVVELASTPLVPAADGSGRIRPDEVVLVTGLRTATQPSALSRVVGGIPADLWWRTDPLRRLGARELPLTEVVDELGGLTLSPQDWRRLYAALEGADQGALGALPVPLVDGRTVRGPRDVFIPTDAIGPEPLLHLGFRVADPEAVHPLLRRLGAVDATPTDVMRSPALQAVVQAIAEDLDGLDVAERVDAVLGLVAAAGVTSEDQPWLSGLPLPDATGQRVAAGELLIPGSPVLDLLDVDPAEYTVANDLAERWGVPLLLAVGVRDGFPVVRDVDVPLDGHGEHDLDHEDGWLQDVLAGLPDEGLPPILLELIAVRDLDLVRDDAWPQTLAVLAADPATRPALVEPAHVQTADGSRRVVRPYTTWWLRRHAFVDGRRLGEFSAPGADPVLHELLEPLTVELDPAAVRALGLPTSLADADPGLLLDRLADPSVHLGARSLTAVYAAVATFHPDTVEPPSRIRVSDGSTTRLVDPAEVVVADGPQWLQLGLPAVVPGPDPLADVLGVELASDAYGSVVLAGGIVTPVPDVVRLVLPDGPPTYVEHDDLVVAGRPVDWWVDGDQMVHAATPDGLARGVAWVAGRWAARFVVADVLRDPSAAAALLAERAFDAEPTRANEIS